MATKPDPNTQTQADRPTAGTTLTKGETVTVFCNMPHGMRLRLFKMNDTRELVMGGGSREIKVAEPAGEEVMIAGVATEIGKLSAAPVIAGYAVTKGVSAEFWGLWLEQNREGAYVKNNCVYAHKDQVAGEDAAKEFADSGLLSGLEPLALTDDPRRPMPRSALVGGVTTATGASQR